MIAPPASESGNRSDQRQSPGTGLPCFFYSSTRTPLVSLTRSTTLRTARGRSEQDIHSSQILGQNPAIRRTPLFRVPRRLNLDLSGLHANLSNHVGASNRRDDLDRGEPSSTPSRAVALLAVGAIEAHGPHLSLDTDRVIAVIDGGGRRTDPLLGRQGRPTAPSDRVHRCRNSPARSRARFRSTVKSSVHSSSVWPDNLARWGVPVLGIANAHLDPAHLQSLHDTAAARIEAGGRIAIAFPDLTRRPWGSLLTDEFKSGACHAGQFETSIVLASSPDRVRESTQSRLEPNPKSLSEAITAGLDSFEAAGGAEAYFRRSGGCHRHRGPRYDSDSRDRSSRRQFCSETEGL